MYKSYKRFSNISTCHRNWKAALNTCRDSRKCSFIHGYSRTIELEFSCDILTNEGWVYDFGNCKMFKDYFDVYYDHAVLIAHDDPEKETLIGLHEKQIIKLTILPEGYDGSIEGCCKLLYDSFNFMMSLNKYNNQRNCRVSRVRIYEHDNNYAEYIGG